MSVLDPTKTYFEEHGEEMLAAANMSKAQFAKAMGVLPQNINKLIATKNILILTKVSSVLNVPLRVLINGEEQQEEKQTEIYGCIYINGKPHIINTREELETLLNEH